MTTPIDRQAARYPARVKIFDLEYTITYVDKPSDVDIDGRESMWGQCDYWTRSIRVLKTADIQPADVWHSIWHEILHALTNHLKITVDAGLLTNDEGAINLLAVGINTIIRDNGWLGEVSND